MDIPAVAHHPAAEAAATVDLLRDGYARLSR
jgi:hypothetical protein